MSVRVYIVAEIRLFRDLLAETLSGRAGVEVVGAAATAETAARLRRLATDVVLLDVRTPDAIAAIRLLLTDRPELKILALAVPELEAEIMRCVEAGVAGYVTEDAELDQLVAALESVARGETLCSPKMAAALVRRVAALAAERDEAGPVTRLTSRELEIMRLIEHGLSNKEIAGRLSIELSTVKNHVHNILEKLGARRRSEAVARLRRSGSLHGQRPRVAAD
jgi:two-component system nitrate/nitrite response regulator NarL